VEYNIYSIGVISYYEVSDPKWIIIIFVLFLGAIWSGKFELMALLGPFKDGS
jgi:hypothetical protein